MKDLALSGKVAIVTGAAAGIGRATALLLAQSGGTVALVDRDADGLHTTASSIRSLGGICRTFPYDLVDWQGTDKLVTSVLGNFSCVDILINCAGINDSGRNLIDVDPALWDKVYNINLRSPFCLMQHVARHLISRNAGGKIVNVVSSSAFRARSAPPTYASSKAALFQLTRSIAAELAPYDVNVNAVAPGLTNTPMMAAANRDMAKEGPVSNLFQRWSEPEDIADAIYFLCSPQSRQITGQVIHVSAGAVI